MKRYVATNRLPVLGVIALVLGSILGGIVIGVLAYYVSDLVFIALLYPVTVGFLTMLVYFKLHQFAKVNHAALTTLCALLMALLVVWFYIGTPHYVQRAEFISDVKAEYGVTSYQASQFLNEILLEESGSRGMLGFMRLVAQDGNVFTNYLSFNGVPITTFDLRLNAFGVWVYWFIEAICIVSPLMFFLKDIKTYQYNRSVRAWYDDDQEQFGDVLLTDKAAFVELLNPLDGDDLCSLVAKAESLSHPKLELYQQFTKKREGDVLIVVKETYFDKKSRVKRNVVGCWEVTPEEHGMFLAAIS